jgi:cytidylate kinase
MTQPKGCIIAIDGPSGAGKSTVAKEVARRLGYLYIDTGAMYRAVGLKALRINPALNNEQEIIQIAQEACIELRLEEGRLHIFLDGVDVTEAIRAEPVSHAASIVSSISGVRRILVSAQQAMGSHGGVVMEGRDIGTKVFPNANLKVFLDASGKTRALRRHEENQRRGIHLSLEETFTEINKRDERDSQREDSPLVQADDAVVIDTSDKTQEEVIEVVIQLVKC